MSASPHPAPPSLESLLDQGPVSLFLDFDGTLVGLAPTPDSISPVPHLNAALTNLSDRLNGACAIVSGRALDDIASHIGQLALAGAGSHGADVRDADGNPLGPAPVSLPAQISEPLKEYAQANALGYEPKPHGAALHYRSEPSKGPEAHAFAEELANKNGWTTQSGKCVVEIVAGQSDKGTAVRAFLEVEPFASTRPFFLGDDLTDEKGFAVCNEFGGAGIIVGERLSSEAAYQLPDVDAVHRWLGL